MSSSHGITVNDANNGARSEQASAANGIEVLIAPQPQLPPFYLLSKGTRDKFLKFCVPLYQAALKGDWRTAEGVIEVFPDAVRARISRDWETALHIAAAARRTEFVRELVNLMTEDDVALPNKIGNTALCYAAASGIVDIAKVMVQKNKGLPIIRGSEGMSPLDMAALVGHEDMSWYLYGVTDDHLTSEDRISLLITTVSSGLYDISLDILKKRPKLAIARNKNGDTALHVLARKPAAFSDCGNLAFYNRCLYSCTRVARSENRKKLQAISLVELIWEQVLLLDEEEISDFIREPSRLLFVAAALGNIEFLTILIRRYPDLYWRTDHENRSIFHVAIRHRQENVFNLIYEIGAIKDIIATYMDKNRNNMLHLAAKSAPPGQLSTVSGAALQFQRELLWFEEVKHIVQPYYAEARNRDGLTPHALFLQEHKDLMKKGEEWMKSTAESCMLVATLIATVMFAAAFTLPGGYKDTGVPIFVRHSSFIVFILSDALSLFSSSTSILMFLSILTSRYSEKDFLKSLPTKLITGLATLFFSIATMMVAFSTAFFIIFHDGLLGLAVPVAMIACVPVTLYAFLQYSLFGDIMHSTYKSRFLFRPKKNIINE